MFSRLEVIGRFPKLTFAVKRKYFGNEKIDLLLNGLFSFINLGLYNKQLSRYSYA